MLQRNARYDILFEPVQIGPKTAKNRFYQVPHCNGMGHRFPRSMAEMRGVKAEGGWGVVCTEECSIHPTSDLSPLPLMRIWDDGDLPVHELMIEKIHAHDALAGIQLVHNGFEVANHVSRQRSMGPCNMPTEPFSHVQARAMDKADIRECRQWHVDAAKRARKVGYDIVYAYAAHGTMTLLYQFLMRRYNQRSDEYGGSLENRVRLIREILQDIKEAVGGDCAVAFRFAVDELLGKVGLEVSEAQDIVGLLADLPDLWDVNISDWKNDSLPSRFGGEGNQEKYINFVKQVTDKPVVGVGRFTSPDTMVGQIKRGVLDFIGAARPSIADPFLPSKIDQGREDEIRECIGCNMCVSGDFLGYPIRCTQNPTMGEEWRRGWHPDRIEKAGSDDNVLVVGAGPSGLEASLALCKRGYDVILSEGRKELGGRVVRESALKPLNEWRRVSDHRVYMLSQAANVQTYVDSRLAADDIIAMGCAHVAIATGANWRRDFTGVHHQYPIPVSDPAMVISPDEIMSGLRPQGKVLIYDNDRYYLASVLAEQLAEEGNEVVLVTPSADIAEWTDFTLELEHIQIRLRELGVQIVCKQEVIALESGGVRLGCIYMGTESSIDADVVIPVTARDPEDWLYDELMTRRDEWNDAGIKTVTAIGDCLAPATIAIAVHSGHEYARGLDKSPEEASFFRREVDFGGE
ncbi:MAG: NADH:flavin oxidoreductase [Gammaproteobacteria bacterium]|nr:NADH:flavin oxidoreductase [Gammaproteobacteria bacterium]